MFINKINENSSNSNNFMYQSKFSLRVWLGTFLYLKQNFSKIPSSLIFPAKRVHNIDFILSLNFIKALTLHLALFTYIY